VGSVLILDVVLGSVLGMLGLNPALRTRDRDFRVHHPVYHHDFRPGVSAEAAWGSLVHPVHINGLGFKDRSAQDVPLQSDRERLLVIGDSFTEGVGIPHEQTFAGLMQARLEGQGIEVLNAGVVTYSPIIYLRKIEYLLEDIGLQVDRVLVFIDLSDIDDEHENYRFDGQRNVVRDFDHSPQKRLVYFLTQRTVLAASVITLYERTRGQAWTEAATGAALGERGALWSSEDPLWEEFGREGMAIAKGHMSELHALLSARGIPLGVVVYPWPDQIVRRDVESRQVTHWRAWAAEREVEFIDLFPVFIDGREPRAVTDRYFIPGDFHWSAEGHALIAESVLERLAF
jgi:hypothetical protein